MGGFISHASAVRSSPTVRWLHLNLSPTSQESHYEGEIEAMIRQIKIDGGTLDDCIAELRILADFVQSQADALTDAWPSLLKDTVYARSATIPGDPNPKRPI